LQRGGADGVNIQWTAFQPFKLGEVTHFHIEAQLGSAAAAIFMAKKRYEALPAAARKIIDENSGEAQSRAFGAFWDKVDQEGRDDVRKLPGHQIAELSPAQKEAWRKKIEPLVAEWTKSTPDGAKVLAAYRQQLPAAKGAH
jgi:TRAP-type transport system periplasmic protein